MHKIWFEGKKDIKTHTELLNTAAGYLSHPSLEGNVTTLDSWSDELIKKWWSNNKTAGSPKDPTPHAH